MPSEGTDAHVTLLVAELLANRMRDANRVNVTGVMSEVIREADVADHLRSLRDTLGRYWRRSAREPGSERELAAIAIDRLLRLQLVARAPDGIRARPALARFALGEAIHAAPRQSLLQASSQSSLF